MKRWWIVIGAVALVGGVVLAILVIAPKQAIPGDVAAQATSTIFVPGKASVAAIRPSVKYDPKLKLLTYKVPVDNTELIVSQQPTPESFTDVPAVYDKVVASMNSYQTFDSPMGKVDLTRPKQNDNHQTAVLNAKGTLMFVKANNDLTSDEWQRFFLNLAVQS